MCGTDTRAGILLGPDPRHVRAARRWAAQATRSQPSLAEPVSVVVSELVTNALKHTASGLPGGTVRVEIERTRLYLVVSVTDQGPRPGTRPTYPTIPRLVPDQPGGNGLRLVEGLCAYWDWEQTGAGVTVTARFER
ncbi:ATP-binding protein [Nocardiopsis sp. FR26]|uniref:ATP-binding protein n=1 Tax=Nocardiopsis sp. FR26 TaxID=2605987 RepID=UPI001F28E189|nr:ATP-binding protein [Nocardiopsis sp. FR26]